MSPDADTDPLARADELFRSLGGSLALPVQDELFSVIDGDYDGGTPERKIYTAQLVIKNQPEKARRALFLLASKQGINRVAKTVGLGTGTVIALRNLFADEVATVREGLATKCDLAAEMLVDRLLDNPDALKPESIGMTVKLLRDTSAGLRGEAPPTQTHTHVVLTADDLRDLAAGMGLPSGANPALPPAAARAVEIPPAEPVGDSESLIRALYCDHMPIQPQAGGAGVALDSAGGGVMDVSP